VTDKIKRELHRRSAVEPVIGHLKSDHRMHRNYLKGRTGNAANAILAAIGYNFSLLLAWISLLWAIIQQLNSESQRTQLA
jgi:IS5 family transposase